MTLGVLGRVSRIVAGIDLGSSRHLARNTVVRGYQNQEKRKDKMGREPSINFVQRFNPTRNKFEWTEQPEEYDFYQEIARSAYADMLHDHDRNKKYEEALAIAIKKVHERGDRAIVLDIGTGTGLLSMMAVRHGADKVYACEAFEPMAKCAADVIKRNRCDTRIKLIPKRSTDLEVGAGKDLEERANILVTEVFDTELIGEGAIGTFNHAHECLLEEECYVVPHAAEIYAMAVECPVIDKWNAFQPFDMSDSAMLKFPPAIAKCNGVPSVHDIQLSQLNPNNFTQISTPQLVFDFNYTEHGKLTPSCRSSVVNFESISEGRCNAIFTWWILKMDREGEIIVTMQPEWWTDNKNVRPTWKEHWMQCIYYLPERLAVSKGQKLLFEAFHDEFSLWYNVKPNNADRPSILNREEDDLERPICECGFHTTISRSRMGMLNDNDRNKKYVSVLKRNIIPGDSVCLVLSESSLLPIMAAKMGAKKVFVIEEHLHSARATQELVDFNKLQGSVVVLHKKTDSISAADLENLKIDLVIGDPFFHSAILPWHNLYFWYSKEDLRWSFAENVKIFPSKAYIKGIAVSFQDLHLIKSPVGTLPSIPAANDSLEYGYDLQDFDNLVLKASDLADHHIDAQPLWEYKGRKLCQEFQLVAFDLTQSQLKVSQSSSSSVKYQKFSATPNGIALWMDWEFDDGVLLGNGPTSSANDELQWDVNSKQGVYFTHSNELCHTNDIQMQYNLHTGDIDMSIVKKV